MWMMLLAQIFQECFDNALATISLLQALGLSYTQEVIFVPTQTITFLGLGIDTLNTTLTTLTSNMQENIRDIAAVLLLKQSCSISTLVSFLGNIVSSFAAVPNGKLYYRNIEPQKIEALKTSKGNFDTNIKQLSPASLSEIQWWYNHIMHAKLSIKPTPDIDYVIYTDASESGWGAHDDINSTGGRWPDDEIHYHINILGLLAIELALKAFLKDSNKKHVRIFLTTPLQ